MPRIYNKTRKLTALAINRIRCLRHKRMACTEKACVGRLAERLGEHAIQWKAMLRQDALLSSRQR